MKRARHSIIWACLLGACASAPPADKYAAAGGGAPADMAGDGPAVDPLDTLPERPADGPPYFPFPQQRQSEHCNYPLHDSADVQQAYDKWKARAVTADGAGGHLRVQRWEDDNDTVSEGIAYGMLLSVYMDDQSLFDPLWQYAQLHLDALGLMKWRIDASGNAVGENAATDADEDMAWALVMADRQWGGSGALPRPYLDEAVDLIDLVWRHEVDRNGGHVLKPGDTWGGREETNPSYFAPAYYRVFGKVTGNEDGWQRVIDASYEILELAAHPDTGLVPAWCDAQGNPTREAGYQYDACRTPFRIAMDHCFNGEPRAKAFADRLTAFFASEGAAEIWDGYALDGSPLNASNTDSLAFSGPAGVGAMTDPAHAGFLEDAYSEVVEVGLRDDWTYSYYNSSWGVLSLLMMSGNFLDYTE